MATPETRNEQVGPTGVTVEGQAVASHAVEDEFATFNRISVLFVLGACLGFAVAIGGFVAEAFWVIVAGSCITLVMALLWVTAGMPPLVRTIRDWLKCRRIVKGRRGVGE